MPTHTATNTIVCEPCAANADQLLICSDCLGCEHDDHSNCERSRATAVPLVCPNCQTAVKLDAAEPPVVSERGIFHAYCYPQGFVLATDRDESDACEAGTPGCCVDHTLSVAHNCETW